MYFTPTYSLQFSWGYDPGAGLSVSPGPAVPQPRAERGEEHGGQPVQEDRGHPPCQDQDHGTVSHMNQGDETIILSYTYSVIHKSSKYTELYDDDDTEGVNQTTSSQSSLVTPNTLLNLNL